MQKSNAVFLNKRKSRYFLKSSQKDYYPGAAKVRVKKTVSRSWLGQQTITATRDMDSDYGCFYEAHHAATSITMRGAPQAAAAAAGGDASWCSL